jgi:WD40 repeat protein
MYHTIHGFLSLYILGHNLHTSTAFRFALSFRFITSLRGHVQAVYQIAWSPDSRLLVSGSADSTLKGKPCLFLPSQGKKYVDTVSLIPGVAKKLAVKGNNSN